MSGSSRSTFAFEARQPLFPEIVELHGRWQRRDALICGERHCAWPEFSAQVNRLARGLNGMGISRGDRVAVVMDNGIEMAVSLFGIMAAGAVSVPVNLTVSDSALSSTLQDSGAGAVIATFSQTARLEALLERAPIEGIKRITTDTAPPPWTSWEELMSSASAGELLPSLADGDLMNIIYSSGTTGQPKGIVHTHRGRLDWAYDLALALRYRERAVTLVTIGMYSNISWVSILCTMLVGGTLVIETGFDAESALDAIERHRVTNASMVPVQYQRIAAAQQRLPRNLSSLNAAMSCGSPLRADLKKTLFSLFPRGVIELFGLTEGIITTLQPEDAPGRWSSVGKPLIGTDLKIIGDNGREVAAGQPGEIVFRGRIVMPGYLNREQATLEVRWVDERGRVWLRSGDIGLLDEEGFLYVVDRKKDMILSGGQNIFPQDIESVLARHPGVAEVAVIGARSERWEETPVAVVVAGEASVRRDELKTWCNERVGRRQRIADVVFVDELPRNPNGKVLKRVLRTRFGDLHYD